MEFEHILLNNAITQAHPWEPFPMYTPKTKKAKFIWFCINLRWKLVKHFVKHKSFLDGKSIITRLNK